MIDFDSEWISIGLGVLYSCIVVGVIMTFTGYTVLAERKICSWMQGRIGPNRTALPIISAIPIIGPFLRNLGIFQPMADGGKFLFKEEPIPGHVNKFYYSLAPVVALVPALLTVTVVPFGQYWDEGVVKPLVLANLDIGILFVLAIGSLGVYGIVMAGWASNNKYSFMGGIRASAQMISYELAMGLSVLPALIWANPAGSDGGLSLFNIVQSQESLWMIIWQPLSAFIFLVALFAETNRLPFDMPESETELVGGFQTEYGAFKFGMFFVAEYGHMVIGSALFTLLFLGGWNMSPIGADFLTWPEGIIGSALSVICFLSKVCCLLFLFIWVRWTLPRFRYDQVMNLGWKILLPLAIGNLIFYIVAIAVYDSNIF